MVRQGHSKGGGWNIGQDRGECAGWRPGLRTPKKEEQVKAKVEGNQKSEQRRQKGKGENETEGRQGRNKLSTWFMDKQKPGRREMRGHKISTGRAEGSI